LLLERKREKIQKVKKVKSKKEMEKFGNFFFSLFLSKNKNQKL
jgi:hypothetical protein